MPQAKVHLGRAIFSEDYRNCLSLRNNTVCCIPLRHLRYLRENIHASVLNQLYKENPMSLADHADNRRQTPRTTLASRYSYLRNNAALLHSLCVICVICERIFT